MKAQVFKRHKSGCGSVWLERCVRDAEAGGSNPLTPTIFFAVFSKGNPRQKASDCFGKYDLPAVAFSFCSSFLHPAKMWGFPLTALNSPAACAISARHSLLGGVPSLALRLAAGCALACGSGVFSSCRNFSSSPMHLAASSGGGGTKNAFPGRVPPIQFWL